MLQVQPALLVQPPRAVAQEAANSHDARNVGNGNGRDAAVGELRELARDPRVGALGLAGSLALGGLVGARGLLLAADALGLRLGLDVLLEEVGVDGVHAGQIDVDEGRRRGGLIGDDFG